MGKLPILTFMSSVYNSMRGFTLLELLLVISVIALLIAITIPTLSNTKEYYRQTQCQNNFSQIRSITEDYYRSNKEYLPWALDIPVAPIDRDGTPSYYKEFESILKCPKGVRISDRGYTNIGYFYYFGWKITNGGDLFPHTDLYHKYNTQYKLSDNSHDIILFMERDRPHKDKRWVLYMNMAVKLETEQDAPLPF